MKKKIDCIKKVECNIILSLKRVRLKIMLHSTFFVQFIFYLFVKAEIGSYCCCQTQKKLKKKTFTWRTIQQNKILAKTLSL